MSNMKRLVVMFLGAFALMVMAAGTNVAYADEIKCTGTIGTRTVDNVFVPAGKTCTLNGTRVEGNVKVASRATLYVNLEEAGRLCQRRFATAPEAAEGLLARGAARVLVTDGARVSADGAPEGILTAEPPEVPVTRITGAGDTFMAAHIVAERRGGNRAAALHAALAAAANHVSGDIGP